MTDPLISVIMPAYNAQAYIAESISSVLAQTYKKWELIVVDDGSEDETATIIQQYAVKDDRIKYFYQVNARQGKAKNLAIQKSSGRFVAFLDADDLWLKEKLAMSIAEISKGDITLLFTDCYVFDDNSTRDISALRSIGVEPAVYHGRSALLAFLEYNKIPNLTVVVKKDELVKAGGFTDLVVAEEYELWLRLLQNGAVFKSISAPLSLYRVHDRSITAADRPATFEVIEIIKAFGKKHPEYAVEINKIVREKIKYWLYYGGNRTAKKFRVLLRGVFSLPLTALFYAVSFLLPVDQFRKIVTRMY